jgi:DNA-binding MarR family transcriptional regulator
MNTDPQREDALTLEILDAIEKMDDVSQRHLAREMGVALGLANSYLKRCIRKGLVKVTQAPANRYLYYLTPKGFAEKSRLTARYLSHSLSFYRKAGESCRQVFEHCERNGWRRLLLCGVSDLAEIATVRASEHDTLTIVGYCDFGQTRRQFLGRPVWSAPAVADLHDICILTDLADPAENYRRLAGMADRERILVPGVLGIDLEHRQSGGA